MIYKTIVADPPRRAWRRISKDEIKQWRVLLRQGLSIREIGRQYNRAHRVITFNLSAGEIRRSLRSKARSTANRCRRSAMRGRTLEESILRRKLITCVAQARKRAAKKNLPIDITFHDLMRMFNEQGGHCSETGIKFDVSKIPGFRANPHCPSADRIDSHLGYVKGNVRLILWGLNWAKGEWPEETMLRILAAWARRKNIEIQDYRG